MTQTLEDQPEAINRPRRAPVSHDDTSVDAQPQPNEPKKGFWKKLVLIAILIVVGGLALVWGVQYWIHAQSYESTDNAFIDGDIIPISSRVSGHVDQVLINDNQKVKAGDVLARLDARDFEARLKQSQAALATAQANVAQAQADVESSRANYNLAQTNLHRFEQMLKDNSASQQEYDAAVASEQVTAADLNAAQKKVAAMQAASAEAQAAVDTAQLNLSYTTITAPKDGRVTRKIVEPGAYIAPGQTLLSIVRDEVWVTANYKETALTHMQPGQPVDLSVDAFPDMQLKGVVDSIQAGTGARFSLFPPENATGNYVKVVQRVPVKILLKDVPPEQMQRLSLGLSVVPDVKVK